MPPKPRITEAEAKAALAEHGGSYSAAERALGVNRTVLRYWAEPEYRQAEILKARARHPKANERRRERYATDPEYRGRERRYKNAWARNRYATDSEYREEQNRRKRDWYYDPANADAVRLMNHHDSINRRQRSIDAKASDDSAFFPDLIVNLPPNEEDVNGPVSSEE